MLEDYFLLVRRIDGIGLSLHDYWEMDSWSTAFLLCTERVIIEKEQEEYDKSQGKTVYKERPDGNSEEINNLMDEMTE